MAHATDNSGATADLVQTVRLYDGPSAVPDRAHNAAHHCVFAPAERVPAKPALITIDPAAPDTAHEHATFAETAEAVSRSAGWFRSQGLREGDRVALRLGNDVAFAHAFFGALTVGLVPVALSHLLSSDEVGFILRDSGAALAIVDPALAMPPHQGDGAERSIRRIDIGAFTTQRAAAPPAEPLPVRPETPAYLIYTSGTTAQPKGVLHGDASVFGRRPMIEGWYGLTHDDRVLHSGALNWTYTLGTGLMDPWSVGATAILVRTGAAGAVPTELWSRLIATHRATLFATVPGLLRRIVRDGQAERLRHDAPTFRHALSAGEALGQDVRALWEEKTGRPVFQAFGMSECSTFVSEGPLTPPRMGKIGRAQPGRRIAVIGIEAWQDGKVRLCAAGETGLLAIDRRENGLMLGYWRRPDETAASLTDQFFVTSDLVSCDAAGFLTHHGRADDVMNAGGYRVSPAEVEAVLEALPGVAEAGVTQIEVRPGVHVIAAFVVAEADSTPALDLAAVDAEARRHLAAYKRPRHLQHVDALPRTANGKLRRKALAALVTPALITPALVTPTPVNVGARTAGSAGEDNATP